MKGLRKVLRSKIHRATVTHADLHYEGSITLPPDLIEAAGLVEYEAVNIWNVTRGTRFETYVIAGQEKAKDICINGAAAHLVDPGNLVIIACFQFITEAEIAGYRPRLVFVDGQNNIVPGIDKEIAGPALRYQKTG
jgi:aspartate 1-decarboxylase